MGKIKKTHFKEPRDYYKNFAFIGVFLLVGIVALIWIGLFFNEKDVTDFFVNREMDGNSKFRSVQAIQMLIAKYFGKKGMLILFSVGTMIASHALYVELSEYRRYKMKCRLYHEGIIKNVYDIYDDYESKTLWYWIKRLFGKKKTVKQLKYPTRTELKRQEEEMQEFFKNKKS